MTQLGELAESVDVAALAQILASGLPPRSKWALSTAADAARTEGIGGVLVLRIPSKGKDFVDISFTIGVVDIITRWAG